MSEAGMHWSTVPFNEAYNALSQAASSLTVDIVEAALQPIAADLKALLSSPPKSETSRAKLGKKEIEIDGMDMNVNDAFINDAAQVADELNLDELVAAKLVFYAADDSKRLEVSTVESAVTLYYVRRQYIIDISRFALQVLPKSKFDLVLAHDGANQIFGALKAVEQNMEDLNERAKTSEFIGFDQNPYFRQLLGLQRDFLVKEHEALGVLYNAYFEAVGADENNPEHALSVFRHMATFHYYDSRLLAYFPALTTWLSAPHSGPFLKTLFSYFTNTSLPKWGLPYWQASIALVLYVFMADETRELPAQIEFSDLLDATRHVIDAGSIEFLFSFAEDVVTDLGSVYFAKYEPLVRSRVPVFTNWQAASSKATKNIMQKSFEQIANAFITNLADILKEMRLSEEDMYLAMNELDEDSPSISPGLDLERFFLFVSCTYRDKPKSSDVFFEDTGGALYGFLTWGANCQVTFMSATYTELLSSLANGQKSSESVHEFLLEAEQRRSQSEEGFVLSWRSIYDVIEYYIRGLTTDTSLLATGVTTTAAQANGVAVPTVQALLTPASQPQGPEGNPYTAMSNPKMPFSTTPAALNSSDVKTSSVSVFPPQNSHTVVSQAGVGGLAVPWTLTGESTASNGAFAPFRPQSTQLSDDTLLVLSSYLDLVARTATLSKAVRDYTRDGMGSNDVDSDNKRDIVPLLFKLLRLQQPISASIFAALTPFASASMWPMLDSFVVGKFEETLTSLPDVAELAKLVERLVQSDGDMPHIHDYIDFLLGSVLPWAANEKENRDIRIVLQLNILGFLKVILRKSDVSGYAFKACFNSKVYGAIFSGISAGVDTVSDMGELHPQVQSIIRGVEVVAILLELSVPPAWSFDRPVLYHLQVVPDIALYCGSEITSLSLASIHLLSLLGECSEFKSNIGMQSRLLSILSSTTESTRIRVGLMARLSDLYTDPSVKCAILGMLNRELLQTDSTKLSMTVAHYLLGFKQSDLGLQVQIELDSGLGGISSNNSLFGVICDMLLGLEADSDSSKQQLRLTSEILGSVTRDPLTSDLVLNYLRPTEFVLNSIRYEPATSAQADYEDFYEHRAIMLELWALEVKKCQEKLLLTLENHYLEAIVPVVFALLDFMKFPRTPVTLRCLKAWCRLVPVLISSNNPQMGPTFVARTIQTLVPALPEFSRADAIYAQPIATLLVSLMDEFTKSGVDEVITGRLHPLFRNVLGSVQPAQLNSDLRTDLYAISSRYLALVLETQSSEREYEALEALVEYGPRLLHLISDDVLSGLNDPLRFNALVTLQLSATLARRLDSAFVVSALSSYNFISIFAERVLGPCILHSDEESANASRASLTLLLEIARYRKGAFDLFGSPLFSKLDEMLPRLSDELLLLSLQLVVAIIMSLGVDNDAVLKKARTLLEKNKSVVETLRRRGAMTRRTLKEEGADSDVPYVVKNISTLVNLTGATV